MLFREKILVLLVLAWVVPVVNAASFDCTKASTRVEKLICADAELSRLDEEMNAAYRSAKRGLSDSSFLVRDQRRWNADRDELCLLRETREDQREPNSELLKLLYEDRISRLRSEARVSASHRTIGKRDFYLREYAAWDYMALLEPRFPNVCERWGRNLNTAADNRPELSCARSKELERNGFRFPGWSKLNLEDHMDLVFKLSQLKRNGLTPAASNAAEETEWRRRVEQAVDNKRIGLEMTTLDLDGDGHSDNVIKFGSPTCDVYNGGDRSLPGADYFVADEQLETVTSVRGLLFEDALIQFEDRVYAVSVMKGKGAVREVAGTHGSASNGECERGDLATRCAPTSPHIVQFLTSCKYVLREALK